MSDATQAQIEALATLVKLHAANEPEIMVPHGHLAIANMYIRVLQGYLIEKNQEIEKQKNEIKRLYEANRVQS